MAGLVFVGIYSRSKDRTPGHLLSGGKLAKIVSAFDNRPVRFVPNKGQLADKAVKFLSIRGKNDFFMAGNNVTQIYEDPTGDIDKLAVNIRFSGARLSPPQGFENTKGRANFYIGKNARVTNVPMFKGVRYKNLYPGIDLIYKTDGKKINQELLLRPGANLRHIKLAYDGVKSLRVGRNGKLLLDLPYYGIKTKISAPLAHQVSGRKLVSVHVKMEVKNKTLTFNVGGYEKKLPLYIELPLSLIWRERDKIYSTNIDANGNAYIAGEVEGYGDPRKLVGRYIDTEEHQDVFVSKLDMSGDYEYISFFGGARTDEPSGMALDASGNAFLIGNTASADFPVTPSAFDTNLKSRTRNGFDYVAKDGFVAKLGRDGSLLYSTLLGGDNEDNVNDIAVDREGNAYLAGSTSSDDFPTSNGAFQRVNKHEDAFIAKLNRTGSRLIYSTFLGGSILEDGNGITIDSRGNAYMTGSTNSSDFPTTEKAFDRRNKAGLDVAFITKIDPTGSKLLYSTYLGSGSKDVGGDLVVDRLGNAYVAGGTWGGIPVTGNALDKKFGGGDDSIGDIFVAKLNQSGTKVIYATFLGGVGRDSGRNVFIDRAGNVYVFGYTDSKDFSQGNRLKVGEWLFENGFVAEVNKDGSKLLDLVLLR